MFKINNHIGQVKVIFKVEKMKTRIFIIHNLLSIGFV